MIEVFDGQSRIERGVAVLKHHLDLPAHFAQGESHADIHRLAVQDDRARIRLDQPDQKAGRGGFAAAELADDSECLTLLDIEGDAVNRPHMRLRASQQAAGNREMLLQIFHEQHGLLWPTPVARIAGGRRALRIIFACRLGLSGHGLSSNFDVHGAAQAIADQVGAHGGEKDHHAGKHGVEWSDID